jgi:hypothetical protein
MKNTDFSDSIAVTNGGQTKCLNIQVREVFHMGNWSDTVALV